MSAGCRSAPADRGPALAGLAGQARPLHRAEDRGPLASYLYRFRQRIARLHREPG